MKLFASLTLMSVLGVAVSLRMSDDQHLAQEVAIVTICSIFRKSSSLHTTAITMAP